ncbi:ABC transporter substrate-binding protein [Fodinicurvata sp. EGI_FJ10296]|uniref:ABC transporter substrate-binding protein n=1 Tax=Fodinicurvata sp. EGI_FJ10296 TaxID=3231908 RepID=UPI00345179AC
MMKFASLTTVAAAALLAAGSGAAVADQSGEVRIGMITTLSGPGSGLGIDARDGFQLGIEHLGGTLGGLEPVIFEGDDQQEPSVAVELAGRMVERDEVDIVTGVIWSNLALAVMPTLARSETFFVSVNAGPSELAGAQCNPFFFNVAWQNDNNHEAMGQHVRDEGYERVYIMAPNYPAGRDALAGFKRFYGDDVVDEVYTPLGQLDYAAELSQLQSEDPDAVYIFYPGGMGINFIRQYEQAGLKETTPLFGPAFSFSQDLLPAVGEAAMGVRNTSQWSPDLDNEVNARFVEGFEERYDRLPSLYASQGYDAALLIDSALNITGGDVSDKDAFREALRQADFDSVRGDFEFNNNHYPIQDYYLREVVMDDEGRITNRLVSTIFEDHADAYHQDCAM